MKPLEHLKALAMEAQRKKYPNFPENARPQPTYKVKTANGLTKAIVDFIRFSGGQAERISVTGRYVDNTKVVTDVLGHKFKIGTAKYIKSSMQAGSADISALFQGKSLKIEVKIGKDRQSEAQRIYQQQVESAGGIYLIVKTFEEFYEKFNQIKAMDNNHNAPR